MLNIITFDARSSCVCACVANVLNGNENIKLVYLANEYVNPQIELINGDTQTAFTYDLTVENGVATIELSFTDLYTLYDNTFRIRYVDGENVGKWFNFIWIEKSDDVINSTMRVDYTNVFKISLISTINKSDIEFSDDFKIDDDGNLAIKKVVSISVKRTSEIISNVTLTYEDETTSSNDCEYDANGNLTKFGNLPITWG